MISLLLAIIYLAFISLGLPDSLLGSGWPVMYKELDTSISYAGIISMIIAGGTITVNGGRSVTSAPDKAARAMTAKAYTSNRGAGECAANYIINAEKYTLGGTGRSEDDSGKITMIDFVTYRNWTKQ